MEKLKNIKTLSKYLISKGVSSPLRLQKLLFFLRYEEISSNNFENSFFNKENNFQAWIYGPVNYESYKFCQNYFWEQDEKDEYLLSDQEIKKIDKVYGEFLKKWNIHDSSFLVEKSHKNSSWIEARGKLDSNVPCNNFLNESKDKILNFIE